MKTSTGFSFVSIIALSTCIAVYAENQSALIVSASTPVVPVEIRNAGRTSLELPSLDYTVQVTGRCNEPLQPESLSVAVADTRRTLASDMLSSDERLNIEIAVPADQIAPLAIAEFCEDGAAVDDKSILIPAVLSMQASLLCSDAERSERHYASSALSVRLECTGQAAPELDSNSAPKQ